EMRSSAIDARVAAPNDPARLPRLRPPVLGAALSKVLPDQVLPKFRPESIDKPPKAGGRAIANKARAQARPTELCAVRRCLLWSAFLPALSHAPARARRMRP